MVCLHLDWYEDWEDKGSYWLVKKMCNICNTEIDRRTVDK